MNEATTIQVGGAERAVRPAAGERKGRRLRRRHLWIVPGLAIAIFANELGKNNGVGILLLIAFGIAPDVPRLFGIGRAQHGGAASLALRAFNLLHHPVAPAVAVAVAGIGVAVAGVVPAIWLVGSLVWFSHVVIGRGVGDVPRHPMAEPPHA
jgi:hypothetical protein